MIRAKEEINGRMPAQSWDSSKSSQSNHNAIGPIYSRHWLFALFKIYTHFKTGPLTWDARNFVKFQCCKLITEWNSRDFADAFCRL
jgi:hypothetical protein